MFSRIMVDVDIVRHLIGAGLLQLVGSAVTASVSVLVLFYLNPLLTALLVSFALLYHHVCSGWGDACWQLTNGGRESTRKSPGG
jgi:hypothetical protein